MKTAHHPVDDYLARYAAGGLTEGEALVVTCHAALCSQCRVRIHAFERVGGNLLDALPEAPLSSDLFERVLARTTVAMPRKRHPASESSAPWWLPDPLKGYLSEERGRTWQRSLIGMRYIQLTTRPGCLRLWEFPAGMRLPRHGHSGLELHLILTGSAQDDRDGRTFGRGDLMCNDQHDEHSISVRSDEPCIALCLHIKPVVPRGLWSRVLLDWLNPRMPNR